MAAHIHAELMMAFAANSDLKIEFRENSECKWKLVESPAWLVNLQYRIKPSDVVINLEIVTAANGVLADMERLRSLNYDFETVDAIHEFAHLFARVLVKKCADAVDNVTDKKSGVSSYMIEKMGYAKDSL
jgi:hypothetical protein